MTRRLCSVTLLAVGLATPLHAQNITEYLALARAYAAGDGVDAEHRLAAWSQDDVTAAASVAASTASGRDLIAAAMLHTELANIIIDAQPDDAETPYQHGARSAGRRQRAVGQREHVEPLVRRWLRLVASIYTSANLLPQASQHVHLGLLRFPDDAGLYVRPRRHPRGRRSQEAAPRLAPRQYPRRRQPRRNQRDAAAGRGPLPPSARAGQPQRRSASASGLGPIVPRRRGRADRSRRPRSPMRRTIGSATSRICSSAESPSGSVSSTTRDVSTTRRGKSDRTTRRHTRR